MQPAIIAIVIVSLLVLAGLLVWLIISIAAARRDAAAQSAAIGLFQQQLGDLKVSQDQTAQTLQKSLLQGQQNLNQNLQTSQQVLAQLNSQIGELQGTNKQMLTLGGELKRLQEILSSPKLRGQMGEYSLANILENVLPKESYQLQYPFKDGKIVDALVKLSDYSVPIDAKFPLPGFERILSAPTDDQRLSFRKQFQKDVIIHIEKIASSYIRPAEGTVDFAIMFIPAENVYYETIVKYDDKDILNIALEKKVIPVSPGLLYAYLMTIAMGLHGLQIEKKSAEILQNLKKLNSAFASFTVDWDTLGTHLRNSYNKYDDARQKLDKFSFQLNQIQSQSDESVEQNKI